MTGSVADLPVRLTGTGPPGGLPVPGCHCRACRGGVRREAAADVAGLRLTLAGAVAPVPAALEVLEAAPGVVLVRAPGDEAGGILWAPAGLPAAALPHLADAAAHTAVLGPPPPTPPPTTAPPNVSAPDALSPAAAAPTTEAPDTAAPTTATPDASASDAASPATATPDASAPATATADGAAHDGMTAATTGAASTAAPSTAGIGAAAAAVCAAALGELRAVGAVAAGCDAVLVGLPHDQPRPDPLLLAAWGLREVADGALLGTHAAAPTPPAARTLVLGGSASGKSAFAEALLAAEPDVLYVATGPAAGTGDAEWAARVAAHRDRRPPGWRTLETADAPAALAAPEPVLLDAVGTWLTGVLDRSGAWDNMPGWRDDVAAATAALVAAWRARPGALVAVSDEVGAGIVPATPAGRLLRTELGRLNQRLAAESDHVYLVTAGRPHPL